MADDFENIKIINKMIAYMDEGFDLIIPSRFIKGGKMIGAKPIKEFITRTGSLLIFYIARLPYKDCTNAFKMFNNKVRQIIKSQASGLLTPTDWYVLKATDVEDYSVPSAISTFRTNVRTRSNEMETAIDNASDVDALATLYAYVNTGTEENPVYERPLGEFPTLEI